jgi:hypothetical protein
MPLGLCRATEAIDLRRPIEATGIRAECEVLSQTLTEHLTAYHQPGHWFNSAKFLDIIKLLMGFGYKRR